MSVAMTQTSALPAGLPVGRRTPRGCSRWYLVHVPEGMEASTCKKVRALVPGGLLEDAFVLSKERWMKRSGAWSLREIQMFPEYFFVASSDVLGLNKALSKLSFHVEVVGASQRACAPLADEAKAFFDGVTDVGRVIRNSVGVIENGVLRVVSGPLKGREDRVVKVDRHKRRCWVRVGEGADQFLMTLALDVPVKS